MAARDNNTVICSVAFVDIVHSAKMSVEAQLRAKTSLNDVLSRALAQVPAADRIVLDTAEGVAIAFIGGAQACFGFAAHLREGQHPPSDAALSIRAGINHGPVRLIKDTSGHPNLIGDGIDVGQRIVRFADPGQILVSRPYHDAITALDPQYRRCFDFLGPRTDQQVRSHDVYALNAAAPPDVPVRASPHATPQRSAARSLSSRGGGVLRRPSIATAMAVTSILVLALVMRQWSHRPDALHPSANPVLETPLTTVYSESPVKPATSQAAAPVIESGPIAPVAQPAQKDSATAKPVPAAPANGTVRLIVAPWGEVYVDGEKLGVAPPLRDIALKPGQHRIEIRNPGFAAHVQAVDVRAGEEVRVRHRFE